MQKTIEERERRLYERLVMQVEVHRRGQIDPAHIGAHRIGLEGIARELRELRADADVNHPRYKSITALLDKARWTRLTLS